MNNLLAQARKEFKSGLIEEGMKFAGGCFSKPINNDFDFIIEPDLRSRYGSVLFGCALGLKSWRHQFVIDRTIQDLKRSEYVTGNLYSIWYENSTFANCFRWFVGDDYELDYFDDNAVAVSSSIKNRIHLIMDVADRIIYKAASNESIIDLVPYLKFSSVYPVDMARCFLNAFFGREEKLREELAWTIRLQDTMTKESYPIFSERLLSLCGSPVMSEILACSNQSELESVVFPPCFASQGGQV